MLMIRLFVCGCVCLMVGCQGSMWNPFGAAGPTQVPPPPTGCARRPDPYYRSSLPGRSPRLSQRTFNSETDRLPDRSMASRAPLEDGASFDVPAGVDSPAGGQLDWRNPASSYEVPAVGSRPRVRLPSDPGYSQLPAGQIPAAQIPSSQIPPTQFDRRVQPAGYTVPVEQTAPANGATGRTPTYYNGWTSTNR